MNDMNNKKQEEIDQLLREFDDFQKKFYKMINRTKKSLKKMMKRFEDDFSKLKLRQLHGKDWESVYREKLLKEIKELDFKNDEMRENNKKKISELQGKISKLLKDLDDI